MFLFTFKFWVIYFKELDLSNNKISKKLLQSFIWCLLININILLIRNNSKWA